MDTLLATRPTIRTTPVASGRLGEQRPAIRVQVLACGAGEHGDDGAPIAAMATLMSGLPADLEVRLTERLDIDDLLAVPAGVGIVVVDAATGIDPGWVIQMPFAGLVGRETGIVLRSAQELSAPGTIGIASMIHGLPLVGIVVVIGGVNFGFGDALSSPVVVGLGAYRVAILDAIERVRLQATAATLGAR